MSIVTINNLPIEILEIIFKLLDLKDLGNCSQTCQLWESIISSIFMNKGDCKQKLNFVNEVKNLCFSINHDLPYFVLFLIAKVLIATGFPYGKCQNVEIIDLTNPTYKCHYAINSDLDTKEPLSISNESHDESGKILLFWIPKNF